ncbi:MAG: DNA polymerase I [Clostridiales Family XIII bacterium]|jgi:DNA polymerase-1|nr:DNA polymerase I [Clostridiales Family XIII bacterium]
MEKRIIIIDGNSLINRAYYAIRNPMTTRDGVYTHGVYGFLNMFEKILRDYDPGYAVVAFDRKAPTFRHREYGDYKAGRRKMPDELAMQLPLLKDVLGALGIKTLEMDGFEADDIIGTVARGAEAAGLEPLVITGDRDALQLATDRTKILITKKGISEFELYDSAAMVEKYGFTPTEFIDFKALMGDQSDNIPGVPGVGEKTAMKLIQEFGSVEALLAGLDGVESEKLRERLRENAVQARMSRRLAEIDTSVPIEMDFDGFRMAGADRERLIEVYTRLEFFSFIRRLGPAGANGAEADMGPAGGTGGAAGGRPASIWEGAEPVTARTEGDMASFAEAAAAAEHAVVKLFGGGDHGAARVPDAISVMLGGSCFHFPLAGDGGGEVLRFVIGALQKLKKGVAGHNLQPDVYTLRMLGFSEGPHMCFDTAIAQYLLDPSRKGYSLDSLALEHLGEPMPAAGGVEGGAEQLGFLADAGADSAKQGAACCAAVGALMGPMGERLKSQGLDRLFHDVEMPLAAVLADMEAAGFAVDSRELAGVGRRLSDSASAIAERIYGLAGEAFNINSPAQLGVILFEKLGLPPSKKTKTGYSTGAEVLEKLRDRHEIADAILSYRMLAKIVGTYVDGLLPLIGRDGRIRAHFQQTVTATGRISCTEPNLQNIPIKHEQGRAIRKAFVPQDGFLLVGADYSQIELRVLAHLTQDEALIEDFRQGADIHRRTAARVFGLSEGKVSPLQRSRAKAVNFGVIYGMSGFGLSEELGITRSEAESYIDEYFRAHGAVRRYMDGQIGFCRDNGYVSTILGRRRGIPEIGAPSHAVRQLGERLAMNTPIQGSAADIIKLAMIDVAGSLKAGGLRSRLVLQVHDELIIEAAKDELDAVKALLKDNMERAFELSVPLVAELSVGANWYELK